MLSLLLDTEYLTLTKKKALVLNRASLDMICTLYIGEEQSAKLESVFTAVRYIYFQGQL